MGTSLRGSLGISTVPVAVYRCILRIGWGTHLWELTAVGVYTKDEVNLYVSIWRQELFLWPFLPSWLC